MFIIITFEGLQMRDKHDITVTNDAVRVDGEPQVLCMASAICDAGVMGILEEDGEAMERFVRLMEMEWWLEVISVDHHMRRQSWASGQPRIAKYQPVILYMGRSLSEMSVRDLDHHNMYRERMTGKGL